MIKRASTILLTLFLLLTSAQVWAETSSTSFEKKDGVTGTYYQLSDVKTTGPFITGLSTNGSILEMYKFLFFMSKFIYGKYTTIFKSIRVITIKKLQY
jgi:hypothetical protein